MKIGLGTAQFGLNYGVSNTKGRVSRDEIQRILALATERGVSVLDTAPAYGESEEAIGACLNDKHSFHIVTKTPSLRDIQAHEVEEIVRDSFFKSQERLQTRKLYGILVHHADDLNGASGPCIVEALQGLKKDGFVDKIGVSVYSPLQIDAVLRLFSPDIVQLPFNVMDQRFLAGGYLRKLKALSVEIHARSLFLQGLLLMNANNLPKYFQPISQHLARYARFLEEHRLTRLEATLGFVRQQVDVDVGLVGVTTHHELQEVMAAWRSENAAYVDMSDFALWDEALINPSKWLTGH